MGKLTHCYFDLNDKCIGYQRGDQTRWYFGAQMYTSGQYIMPEDFDPRGKTASELMDYSVRLI